MDDCLIHLQTRPIYSITSIILFTPERTQVQPLQTQMEPLYLTWTISLSQNKELRSFYRKATHRKQLDLTWYIPARILRECSEELAPILTIVLNRTLQTGRVPEDLKQANVSAVFKKGQRYDLANYRSVSLTCLCCKMLEHIITSSIMKHVDHHQILSDCQHGFRARRSCETQLVTLINDLSSSLDRGV